MPELNYVYIQLVSTYLCGKVKFGCTTMAQTKHFAPQWRIRIQGGVFGVMEVAPTGEEVSEVFVLLTHDRQGYNSKSYQRRQISIKR
jgi:hypothetical protein